MQSSKTSMLGRRLLLGCALVPVLSATAYAQEAVGLSEIVVTAQKRSENLQDVPISVAAITAADAAKLGVVDLQSVVERVPGVTFNRASTSGIPFIRGVGSSSGSVGNESSVAMYVDDVYQATAFGDFFGFNNIEAVEVLKGPQGTLFGRNATGGVIHIRTRNPTHTPTADLAVTAANYDTWGTQFYGSAGLSDTVAVNLAAFYKKQAKGWGRNIFTGNDAYKGTEQGYRAKLLWEPTDATSVLLSAEYAFLRSEQGLAGALPPGYVGRAGFVSTAGANFYDTTGEIDNHYKNWAKAASAKVSHDLGAARLVSITAFTHAFYNFLADVDVTPTPFFNANNLSDGRTITQELQLLSPDESEISWIIGGFYMNDSSRYHSRFTGTSQTTFGLSGSDTHQKTDSFAGFAQMTFEIMPDTNLTVGLRYTIDRRRFDGSAFRGIGAATTLFGPFRDRVTYSAPSGRFAIDHKVNDDLMIYASYNRGFKSGVYNLTGLSAGATTFPVSAAPETLSAYSLGFKSQWADDRVRLNAEAFYYDYQNIQVQTTVGAASVLSNAGAAKIKGLDVELTVQPVSDLRLSAALVLLDGEYTKFPGGPTFYPQPPNGQATAPCAGIPPYPSQAGAITVQRACDLSGMDTINTPPISLNLSAAYRLHAGNYPVDLAASYALGGDYFFDPDNSAVTRQKRTQIVNASVTVASPDERYSLQLWGKNLTKEEYYSYAQQSTTPGSKFSPAPPRTYGVTLRAGF